MTRQVETIETNEDLLEAILDRMLGMNIRYAPPPSQLKPSAREYLKNNFVDYNDCKKQLGLYTKRELDKLIAIGKEKIDKIKSQKEM